MKKILVIGIIPPPFNGQSVATQYLVDLFKKHHIVHLLKINPIENRTGQSGKFSLVRSLQVIKSTIELYFVLKKQRPDFVYIAISCTFFGHVRDLLFYSMIYIFKSKFIVQVHSNRFPEMFKNPIKKFTTSILLRNTNKVIISSKLLYDPVKNHLPYEKIVIIGNTIRKELLLSAEEINRKLDIYETKVNLNILYLSNLIKEKGYFDLLKCAAILRDMNLNLKFTFAGPFLSSDQKTEIDTFINDNHLENNVSFIGPVNNYKQLLIDSDIFVLPTYYSNEAQPIALIEAINAGMAIISTNVGSIPDILNDGNNGFIVNPKAPEQIAQNIENIYLDRKLLKKMGGVSRNIFDTNYTPNVIEQKYLDLFDNI